MRIVSLIMRDEGKADVTVGESWGASDFAVHAHEDGVSKIEGPTHGWFHVLGRESHGNATLWKVNAQDVIYVCYDETP